MAVYVVGHKNPDTDSVAAAIAVADLMNKSQSMGAIAAAQGPLNPESAFVLEKVGVAAPEIVTDATDKKIILVDHSDLAQSLDNLAKLQRHPPRPVVLRPLRQLSRPALQIPPKQAYFSSV